MSEVWVDAQLSPGIALWLGEVLGIPAHSVHSLGLRDSDDGEIFRQGAAKGAIILTKDADFQLLLERHGPPPDHLADLRKFEQWCPAHPAHTSWTGTTCLDR